MIFVVGLNLMFALRLGNVIVSDSSSVPPVGVIFSVLLYVKFFSGADMSSSSVVAVAVLRREDKCSSDATAFLFRFAAFCAVWLVG